MDSVSALKGPEKKERKKKRACPGLNCNHTSGSPKAASQTARGAASSSLSLSLSVVLKHFKLICSQRKMGYDATVEVGNETLWSVLVYIYDFYECDSSCETKGTKITAAGLLQGKTTPWEAQKRCFNPSVVESCSRVVRFGVHPICWPFPWAEPAAYCTCALLTMTSQW